MFFIDILLILLLILVVLSLVYVFILAAPKAGKVKDQRLLTSYAHRGLHGSGVPENSLEAFRKATGEGYGIELDVQLSKDKEVMVFHDYTLVRMTGVDKKLCDLLAEELKQLNLAGTRETIPAFKEVLEEVAGRVPLLIELKGESFDTSLCEKVASLLKDYKGPYCIESFNPLLIKAMKKYLPDSYYGQLYTNVCKEKKKYSCLNILLTLMALNVLSRPDFIAFNKNTRNSFPVKLTTKFYKAVRFVWTVKSQEEYDEAISLGEYPIFERM